MALTFRTSPRFAAANRTALYPRFIRACSSAMGASLPSTFALPSVPSKASLIGSMRLILDSADVEEWGQWFPTGVFHGVTTNPSILEKDGVECSVEGLRKLVKQAREVGAREIQLQSWGSSVKNMITISTQLVSVAPDLVVIKLPCTEQGLTVASILRNQGVRVTITGIYTAHQVLLAQSVGAEYAAPYLGRIDDVTHVPGKGLEEVMNMQQIVTASKSSMRILVASIRDPAQMATLAAAGCDTFTFSPAIAQQLFNVDATLKAASDFETAAARNRGG